MRICERRRFFQLIVGVTLMLVPVAFAAQASAASLAVNKKCYVNTGSRRAPMAVLGSGFVPGDPVNLSSSDDSVIVTATANASGKIGVITGAPIPPFSLPGSKTVTLTARDFTASGTIIAKVKAHVAPLAVATKPAQARLSKKVTWYLSGFRPGKFVYGHYLRKKEVARAKFGRAKGPCGLLKVKDKFYPGGHPPFKSYGLQIDDSRRYTKHASPKIDTKLGTFLI